MRFTNIAAAWAVCAAFAFPALGQDSSAPEATQSAEPPAISFKYQSGNIVLPNKVATLHLGDKYRYLDPSETNKLLVAWGNPADDSTQGAIIPAGVEPLSEGGWAVFLTYLDEGHVDDSDAKEIDYDELLEDMQEGIKDSNPARKEAGYPTMQLIKWAEPPRYDISSKKLYWAKELDFEGSSEHTLNYDVRVLGREGVLSMEAVAGISQLAQIRTDMKPLLAVAEFNEGHRYAEFNSKTDRAAEYGLGALIAGGVAAKLGLFGKLGVMLLAFKKFILIGLVFLGGIIAKLFGKKKDVSA